MELEWAIAAVVITVLSSLFGHFEAKAPLWTRITRWLVYLAVLLVVELLTGRPWTWVWIAGLPAVGATFHVIWFVRHQNNPLTTEPRERYFQLRGWA
ncbi:hypothetical protein [Amycolatopsis sp. CA-126428]|uniref:hypothetical protein n=1 Tax=Amycolatopsis sp. CA-126428 TaxID=2073158 RepID=UPI000CD01A60|nr:hypothetical protein [Amycolatopsis sp. CA-126428]